MCTWCVDPDADDINDSLCIDHMAEALGTTVDQMVEGDRIQYAEWLDTQG